MATSTPSSATANVQSVHDYWNARPCNLRHSPQTVGSKEYFDDVEARKYRVEPHIPAFADFERWRGKKVLEIGCGLGTDTINFARHGAHVTAVDLTERSLELARQRAQIYGLSDQIRFVLANAEELHQTLAVEPYDLIYSFGVIHHTPNPGRVLEELRRYTHPGTELRVMVYHRHSWKVLWILLTYGKGQFWKLGSLIARHSEAQTGCPVTFSYTRRGGRRWLAEHGFVANEVFVDHIFPYRIRDYVQYRYRRVWYFRWMPQWLFRHAERRWGWHLCMSGRPQPAGRR